MSSRRPRAGVLGLFTLILMSVSMGTVAAAECALEAPSYANVGTPLTITGTGFPANVDVFIDMTLDGAAFDSLNTPSDAAGAIELSFTPESLDIGELDVTGSAGSTCSAQATINVLAAGETPPPAPTGATEDAAGDAQAPRTDASGTMARQAATPPAYVSVIAWILVAAGIVGLIATSPSRRSGGRTRR